MKLALVLFLTLCGIAAAATLPDSTIPAPFGVQLKPGNPTTQSIEQVNQLGLKAIRRGFYWESIEKTKGQYDFAAYDDWVKDCQSKGISIIGCLFGNNKLYSGNVQTDEGREGFAKFSAACAAHFKDVNIYWEIWNEPNTQTFWGKHVGSKGNSEQFANEYVALVKVVAPAIHQADAKAIVLGGATSGIWHDSYAWMNFVFQKGILKTGIDVWSIHPYSSKCPEDYIAAYAIVRKEMADAGGPADMPMIDSERGFPINSKGEGFAGGDAKMAYEYQAWHLVRQYMIDQLEGIKLTSWYEWNGKEGFNLYEPNKPTQAYTACKVMIDQLTGYHFDKRIDVSADRDFVLRFVNKSGGEKLVAWTAPPTGGSPDQAKAHDVDVPVEASGDLAVVSIYGDKKSAAVDGGKVKITLEGAPQYVTVK